jgi:RNA polymerase primary sigma factor
VKEHEDRGMTQANHLLETIEADSDVDLLVDDSDGDENFVAQDDEADTYRQGG